MTFARFILVPVAGLLVAGLGGCACCESKCKAPCEKKTTSACCGQTTTSACCPRTTSYTYTPSSYDRDQAWRTTNQGSSTYGLSGYEEPAGTRTPSGQYQRDYYRDTYPNSNQGQPQNR
jgi:hypothetical protein